MKTLNRYVLVLGLVLLGTLSTSHAMAGPDRAPRGNIVQVARTAGTFNTLIQALEATDLIGTLSGQGHGTFTVFAPTDAAFAKLPAGTLQSLLADPAALKKILLYHVISGTYPASDVISKTSLTTLAGQNVSVSTSGGVRVNDANVIATDVMARNGVIHVIDTVLIPQ